MKKFLIALCACACFVLGGCTKEEQFPEYERSTEMGLIQSVQFSEMLEKMENKETFMMAISQTTCPSCLEFKETVLSSYIVDHGFVFNEVILQEQDDTQPIFDFVKENPNPDKYSYIADNFDPTGVYTPTFYFVVDGELKETIIGKISYEEFDEAIRRHKIDEIKK